MPASRSLAPRTPVTRSSGTPDSSAMRGTIACLEASDGALNTPISATTGISTQMDSRPAQNKMGNRAIAATEHASHHMATRRAPTRSISGPPSALAST